MAFSRQRSHVGENVCSMVLLIAVYKSPQCFGNKTTTSRRHDYRGERICENLGIFSGGGFDTLSNRLLQRIGQLIFLFSKLDVASAVCHAPPGTVDELGLKFYDGF
jgi:hypothetical protein